MSKSSLQGFTRGFGPRPWAERHNRNAGATGPIDTDMNPADSPHADYARSRMALGHYGAAEDVAGLVSFLSSDDARHITGSWITVDGGFNA